MPSTVYARLLGLDNILVESTVTPHHYAQQLCLSFTYVHRYAAAEAAIDAAAVDYCCRSCVIIGGRRAASYSSLGCT